MSDIRKDNFTFFALLFSFIFLSLTAQVNAAESITLPYSQIIQFNGFSTEYYLNLKDPPLKIDYQVTPVWESGQKQKCQNADCTIFELVDYTRVAKKSWFLLSVANSKTSDMLVEDGFGNTNDINTEKSIMVRNPGPYLIKVSGNFVTVRLNITSLNSNSINNREPVVDQSPQPIASIPEPQNTMTSSSPMTTPRTNIVSKSDSVPIWDRNILTYLVLLVFVILFVAILYDTNYKKKENMK